MRAGRIALALAGLGVLAALSNLGQAQEAPVSERNFVGQLEAPTGKLHIALHLHRDATGLSGTVDSPDQNAFGLPLANIRDEGDELRFEVPVAKGSFVGQWGPNHQKVTGKWIQAGLELPITLIPGGYPATVAPQWDQRPVTGLTYTPARVAKPTVGPAYRLGKCINMSDMMEAPKEGDWGPGVAEDDFKIIRKAGFSTVRLPIAWSSHAGLAPPYTIDPLFMARVHHVVDLATASGLRIMLDMHNFTALEEDPAGQKDRFTALWVQIARSFAKAPASVWFELLNEPHNQLNNANLGAIYAPALRTIRADNPQRVVVMGAAWNNLDRTIEFAFPDDPNIVPSFHYYDPFLFTHQGATWFFPAPPLGRGFGSAEDKANLDATLAKVSAYMRKSGRLPFVGEYGAQDDARVPLEQRIRYYGTVSSAFASVGVDSCAWGYRTGFRIREGDHWLPGMLDAIRATR